VHADREVAALEHGEQLLRVVGRAASATAVHGASWCASVAALARPWTQVLRVRDRAFGAVTKLARRTAT